MSFVICLDEVVGSRLPALAGTRRLMAIRDPKLRYLTTSRIKGNLNVS